MSIQYKELCSSFFSPCCPSSPPASWPAPLPSAARELQRHSGPLLVSSAGSSRTPTPPSHRQVRRRDLVQGLLDPGLVQDSAQGWKLLEEHEYRRQEAREQQEDAVRLNDEAYHRPAPKHEGEAREEGYAPPPRPLSAEEADRGLGPNDHGDAGQKKEVSHRQKAPVEEEQSSEEHEKHAEAREAQAYLSPVVQEHGACAGAGWGGVGGSFRRQKRAALRPSWRRKGASVSLNEHGRYIQGKRRLNKEQRT